VQGGAVTTFLPFADDGRPRFCDPPEPPDEPPPPPELDWVVQGGTMIVVTPLLLGRTSWFIGWPLLCELPPLDPPEEDELDCAFTPPGVSRTVLGGGGMLWLDDEPPLDPPDEDDCSGGGQGWTATVCVRVPGGTTIWFEPGGIFEPPDCVTDASEQGGTAIVRSPCCFGITTVRTPGFWSAVETASICFFLPQALTPSVRSTTQAVPITRQRSPVMYGSPPVGTR
jgi:hypothetical protein